ncbi:hypothetical protein P280DRAFT_551594 [Massarina eburnea CBS 473.64]|uniref:Uncharacterized protein n=1 Tax=Massarina eburnea CBS 473.64 TaxID=1395130 RepID=A0A6A6RTB0_9PLEO|nr:hypothetical protein P280DRAFT_551594 [Massarina eburnea CBS 473.64]
MRSVGEAPMHHLPALQFGKYLLSAECSFFSWDLISKHLEFEIRLRHCQPSSIEISKQSTGLSIIIVAATMHLTTLLTASASIFALATAAPLASSAPRKGPFPTCGNLRFNNQDGWNVGFTSSATCTPVHPWRDDLAAQYYRISNIDCECKFYKSKESCQQGEDVKSYFKTPPGPDPSFEEKPKYLWCRSISG